jgi:hypothetical protein
MISERELEYLRSWSSRRVATGEQAHSAIEENHRRELVAELLTLYEDLKFRMDGLEKYQWPVEKYQWPVFRVRCEKNDVHSDDRIAKRERRIIGS